MKVVFYNYLYSTSFCFSLYTPRKKKYALCGFYAFKKAEIFMYLLPTYSYNI